MLRNVNVLLHLHGAPLANKPMGAITADIVQAALKDLWAKTPLQGRRTLAAWAKVFDFAKAKGMRTGDNPCAWKGCHQYRWPKVRGIDRNHFAALEYQQMPKFMKALRQRQNRGVAAIALEFTILTACRSGEAFGAQWSEFDLENRVWTLLPFRTKQGRQHQIPLCDRVMEILTLQRQYSNGSGYVFEGYKRTLMAHKGMKSVLVSMGLDVTVHGMRSTFRDWAGDMTHYARNDIEECLGHAVGDATERAYRRSEALKKRRIILEAWEAFCAGELQP
jgi:integrase